MAEKKTIIEMSIRNLLICMNLNDDTIPKPYFFSRITMHEFALLLLLAVNSFVVKVFYAFKTISKNRISLSTHKIQFT